MHKKTINPRNPWRLLHRQGKEVFHAQLVQDDFNRRLRRWKIMGGYRQIKLSAQQTALEFAAAQEFTEDCLRFQLNPLQVLAAWFKRSMSLQMTAVPKLQKIATKGFDPAELRKAMTQDVEGVLRADLATISTLKADLAIAYGDYKLDPEMVAGEVAERVDDPVVGYVFGAARPSVKPGSRTICSYLRCPQVYDDFLRRWMCPDLQDLPRFVETEEAAHGR